MLQGDTSWRHVSRCEREDSTEVHMSSKCDTKAATEFGWDFTFTYTQIRHGIIGIRNWYYCLYQDVFLTYTSTDVNLYWIVWVTKDHASFASKSYMYKDTRIVRNIHGIRMYIFVTGYEEIDEAKMDPPQTFTFNKVNKTNKEAHLLPNRSERKHQIKRNGSPGVTVIASNSSSGSSSGTDFGYECVLCNKQKKQISSFRGYWLPTETAKENLDEETANHSQTNWVKQMAQSSLHIL